MSASTEALTDEELGKILGTRWANAEWEMHDAIAQLGVLELELLGMIDRRRALIDKLHKAEAEWKRVLAELLVESAERKRRREMEAE